MSFFDLFRSHVPLIPGHCLVICSHCCYFVGSFARLFVVLSPLRLLFLIVLGRAFLALCLYLVFSLVPLLLWLLWVVFFCWCFCLRFCGCLLFGLCVPPLVLWSFLGCCFLMCCGRLPSPLTLFSLSPSVVPFRRPGPVTVLVPPSRYLVASCDGPVALPNAWGVVVLCFLASSCCMAAKAFGLCGVFC